MCVPAGCTPDGIPCLVRLFPSWSGAGTRGSDAASWVTVRRGPHALCGPLGCLPHGSAVGPPSRGWWVRPVPWSGPGRLVTAGIGWPQNPLREQER